MNNSGIKIIKRRAIQASASVAPTNKSIDERRMAKDRERQIARSIGDWVRTGRTRRDEELEKLRSFFGDSAVLAKLLP